LILHSSYLIAGAIYRNKIIKQFETLLVELLLLQMTINQYF